MCLTLILTFLSVAPLLLVQGRMITCSCTTVHCREEGTRTCSTTGLCFSQYLDRRDGSDPLVRGCISGRTHLLCENRRPAVDQHRTGQPSCAATRTCATPKSSQQFPQPLHRSMNLVQILQKFHQKMAVLKDQ
ncbi:uncharacterized protein TNCT_513221 [Trichonephila clavata]|uniref:BMP and activin membrane-bound inhibitor N-terminal domain-containing protein n=1 Tax=Trichonephila clavata TaxID=2740835 RepID=A0A8X6KQX4_TRICU|nr:uncharacterized protein TNCT_513221 [Trichonephila clavata]